MNHLHVISAGAAKGLVEALQAEWTVATGAAVEGMFGAVGAMKEKLLGGAPCDVLILTQAMLEVLARTSVVEADSIRPLGLVYTGVAIPDSATRPAIDTPAALRQSLLRATAVYLPDPERATAGIHFANVLTKLGIAVDVAPRLRAYPNGATAMREMAQAGNPNAIGCTQVTEILYTAGVSLAGLLPTEFALSTLYSVAVCAKSARHDLARRFVALLSGASTAQLRQRGGFPSPD